MRYRLAELVLTFNDLKDKKSQYHYWQCNSAADSHIFLLSQWDTVPSFLCIVHLKKYSNSCINLGSNQIVTNYLRFDLKFRIFAQHYFYIQQMLCSTAWKYGCCVCYRWTSVVHSRLTTSCGMWLWLFLLLLSADVDRCLAYCFISHISSILSALCHCLVPMLNSFF